MASVNDWVSSQVLPSPAVVWNSALDLTSEDLITHILISLRRLVIGLSSGLLAGVALGTLIGLSRRVERLVLPIFSSLAQVPTLAWVPLFMLWFGIDESLKLVVVIKAVIVPITFHTAMGVRDIPFRLQEASSVLRLSPLARTRYLIIPAMAPSVIAGCRTALGTAWSSLIAVELLASSDGLGYLMVWGRQLFMLDVVMVCICIVAVIGIALDRGISWVDQAYIHWPQSSTYELKRRPVKGFQHVEPWVLPALLFLIWFLNVQLGTVNSNILVSPVQVLIKLWHGVIYGDMAHALYESLRFTMIGLLVGGGLGIFTGVGLGLSKTVERACGPVLAVIRHVAIFAWVPLITAWLGLGDEAKVAFIALACFSPLLVATQAGVANLSPQLNEAARVMRLRFWHRMTKLILPGVLSSVFSGLRVSLIYAWLATIGAEYFITTTSGIGSYMIAAQQLFRIDDVMAAMVLIGITGAIIHKLGYQFERLASSWRFK
ncbi:ABC transporter permease [Pseudomonas sp. LB-090624]|uniref:ABC transporter permease n=1 Tax=Pseudomonas sp. LB-090624 TaxID=2213079 RepID=UPI0021157A8D|nr:ABC transporter permease [Pseudomonas sp. LB-090624]